MALSTMQEILILLEDEKEVPLYRINRWGRPARGALAKLKNLGWAEKFKQDSEPCYRITEKGEKYFDDVLENLKQKHWDKKWRLVIFDIPEINRKMRDRLRRNLNNLGMGILQASVWISAQDIKEKIEKIRERLHLQTELKYFEVTSNGGLDKQIVEKAWNIPEINIALERLVLNSERALRNMGKGNGDRYNAKKLIFEYALILNRGPKLPFEFFKQNDIRKKAYQTYLKLRNFVV